MPAAPAAAIAQEAATSRSVPLAYEEPFAWWGPVWATPHPRTIRDLIADGTLSAELAALLWALLARRASLAVVAGPSGAGKTTLLTALLDFLPAGARRLYLRGCYEPFAFVSDPAVEPDRSYLLVNEISGHLPVYLWGPGVRRALQAARSGFGLAATAHARSVTEFVQSLAGYPLRVPAAELAAFDLVVVLDAWRDGGGVRRQVRSIATLAAAGGADNGLTIGTIVERRALGAGLTLDLGAADALFTRLGGNPARLQDEVAERMAALTGLVASSPEPPESLPARLIALESAGGWTAHGAAET